MNREDPYSMDYDPFYNNTELHIESCHIDKNSETSSHDLETKSSTSPGLKKTEASDKPTPEPKLQRASKEQVDALINLNTTTFPYTLWGTKQDIEHSI